MVKEILIVLIVIILIVTHFFHYCSAPRVCLKQQLLVVDWLYFGVPVNTMPSVWSSSWCSQHFVGLRTVGSYLKCVGPEVVWIGC